MLRHTRQIVLRTAQTIIVGQLALASFASAGKVGYSCTIHGGINFQYASKSGASGPRALEVFLEKVQSCYWNSWVDIQEAARSWSDSDLALLENTDFTCPHPFNNNKGNFGRIDTGGASPIINPLAIKDCERKISAQFKNYRDLIAASFAPEDGFVVSESKGVAIPADFSRRITFYPVTIASLNYPDFKAYALYGSEDRSDGGRSSVVVQPDYFVSGKALEDYISDLTTAGLHEILGDLVIFSKNNLVQEAPPTSKKQNAIFGVSFGIDKLFVKEGNKIGFYTGCEVFADINPTKCTVRSSKAEVIQSNITMNSHGFGITPFLGIGSKDSWTLFVLAGPRFSFKNIKTAYSSDSDYAKAFNLTDKKFRSNKVEFDVGVGTAYTLSSKFTVGIRFIHTLKSSMKFKSYDGSEAKLSTHSSRIVATFSYRF